MFATGCSHQQDGDQLLTSLHQRGSLRRWGEGASSCSGSRPPPNAPFPRLLRCATGSSQTKSSFLSVNPSRPDPRQNPVSYQLLDAGFAGSDPRQVSDVAKNFSGRVCQATWTRLCPRRALALVYPRPGPLDYRRLLVRAAAHRYPPPQLLRQRLRLPFPGEVTGEKGRVVLTTRPAQARRRRKRSMARPSSWRESSAS